jgi:uncharacterized protein YegL
LAIKDVNVIAILDMSGSMSGMEDDTRGGFNAFVNDAQADQAAEGGRVSLSLTCFDTEFIQIYGPTDIQLVKAIGPAEYTPRGGTALLDAIGRTIGPLAFPRHEKVLVYIVTDGYENSSREWTNARVKALIEAKESQGWQFLFIGAGLDAWAASQAFATPGLARSTISANATPAAFAAASARATGAGYRALRWGGSVEQAVDALYESDDSTLINRGVERRGTPRPPARPQNPTPRTSARRKTFRELRHS